MRTRTPRPGVSGWCPRCEGLEARRLLSLSDTPTSQGWFEPPFDQAADLDFPPFSFLEVVGSRPAPGEVVRQPLTTLAVGFDRELDPVTLGNDFALARIAEDGGLVFIDLCGVEGLDPNDPSWIVLTLDQPLPAGHYRLFLSAASFPSGLDGSFYFNPDGADRHLADFAIETPGVSLNDALDLGRIGPTPRVVAGTLDFTANPQAVQLYRFELPGTRNLWQVGLEVAAGRIGSGLRSALAVFDSQGQAIATASLGRKDAPSDPFLFRGLAPGVYYVGLSAQENRPGLDGAYDPATGDPGQIVTNQQGGPFELTLLAEPVGRPVQVLGFRLDFADPHDPVPTGFTIQFSGPILVGFEGSSIGGHTERTLELVDQDGRAWPIAGAAFDEARSIVTFLFCARLPEGRYAIRVPDTGGLTDLAGRAPVGRGRADDVLAEFRVAPPPRAADPTDLGVLYPVHSDQQFQREQTLQPGETVRFRYVLAAPDTTRLTFTYHGTGLKVELVNASNGQVESIEPGPPETPRNALLHRYAGVYYLQFTALGDKPVTLRLALATQGTFYESVLLNGVGQGPALNLRLIAPTLDLAESPSSAPLATPAAAPATHPLAAAVAVAVQVAPPPTTTPASAAETIITVPTPLPGPGNLFLSIGSEPVGFSASVPAHGALVAASEGGLPGGPGLGQGPANGATLLNPATDLILPDAADEIEIDEPARQPEGVDRPAGADPPPTLAESIAALAEQLALDLERPTPRAETQSAELVAHIETEPLDATADASLIRIVTGPFGASELAEARIDPFALGGVLALCALPFHNRLARWLTRVRTGRRAATARPPYRPPLSGPHAPSRRRQPA